MDCLSLFFDHLDRGIYLMQLNRHQEAIKDFEVVLQSDPGNRFARWNRCLALMSLGEYDRGWSEHDWAWKIWQPLWDVKGIDEIPAWSGQRCRLLIYHDMGFGDAIMLMRFLPRLVDMCDSVTLVVRSELVSLMQGKGVEVVDSIPEDVSMFDKKTSLFNSIGIAGLYREIPNDPYIKPAQRLYSKKLGIAWSGNSQKSFTINGFLSSINLTPFNEIFALQKIKENHIYVGSVDRVVHSLNTSDFKDTADAMLGLDCIITVDTAAAHLAGAIGHPNAHVVIPFFRDWRWWNKDLWYPTLNIYPQEDSNDWESVFSRVNEAICIS